jgi:hypothetical protein
VYIVELIIKYIIVTITTTKLMQGYMAQELSTGIGVTVFGRTRGEAINRALSEIFRPI